MAASRASNGRTTQAGAGLKRARSEAGGSRVTVVLGAQWGDEGKGKVVDLLATEADLVCRCQGWCRRHSASTLGSTTSKWALQGSVYTPKWPTSK